MIKPYTATPQDQAVITEMYNQLATGQPATEFVDIEQVNVTPTPPQPIETESGSPYMLIGFFILIAITIYFISKS